MPDAKDFPSRLVSTVVTITGGASVSAAFELHGTQPVAVLTPTAWTSASAANIRFLASVNVGASTATYRQVQTVTGGAVALVVTTNRFRAVDPNNFRGVQRMKLQSASSTGGIVQSAARTLTVVSRPV